MFQAILVLFQIIKIFAIIEICQNMLWVNRQSLFVVASRLKELRIAACHLFFAVGIKIQNFHVFWGNFLHFPAQ